MPIIDLSATPLKHSKASLKRIEDIIISTAMLILLSPLIITVAILIKRDSKGSILFKQLRYGLDGKEIEVWKFRSMTTSDNGKTVEQAIVNDPRITPIGKFIRKYSIDELPQLFNVLYGSMSLVGPRPHAVAHNEYYRDKIDGYMSRHTIRPGITGWAQVNGLRGETDTVKKMERRVRYDIEYIQKWSILFDIRILLKTITEVFRSHTAY
jgi:putative colanic acid biosynthesis UDP-glucose lipid carrier transferase